MSVKTINNFLTKIKMVENSCWEWTGSKSLYGYGRFRFNGRVEFAHRVSYKIFKDDIKRNAVIMHVCDNPQCVNPRHLRSGTQHDNIVDMVKKGRHASKNKNYIPSGLKLATEEVEAIRDLYFLDGLYQYQIANIFGISQTNVGKIVNAKKWKRVIIPEYIAKYQ